MTNEKKNWRKQFWNSEKLIGISAMIISVGTLFVLVYQTRLIREQQYKSVYPHLTIMKSMNTYDKEFSLFVENNGIGPAMIRSTKIIVGDSIYNTDFGIYLHNMISDDSIGHSISTLNPGKLLPEKEMISLFSIYNKVTEKQYSKVLNLVNKPELDFIIEYESIYGERWRLSYKENIPQKIN